MTGTVLCIKSKYYPEDGHLSENICQLSDIGLRLFHHLFGRISRRGKIKGEKALLSH